MAQVAIPKPEFVSCNETSIKVKIQCICGPGKVLKLQYKEQHLAWPLAKEMTISSSSSTETVTATLEIVDLTPGTAYFLRIGRRDVQSTGTEVGGEIVFDTKPVDCGPKKGCSVS